MPISIAARKPQATVQSPAPPPPPAVNTSQQAEQQDDAKDDATVESPAGNE